MAWFKTGGGALSETVLWTNQSPSSNFTSQSITLNQGISSFKSIRIYWKISTTKNTEYCLDIPVESFIQINYADPSCFFSLGTRTGSFTYSRVTYYKNDTQITIGQAYRVGNTGSNDSYSIPTKVCGLK